MNKSANSLSLPARLWLLVLGVVILAAGLFFAIGGGKLFSLGGSPYFVTAGAALVISGLLIILRKPAGALLFGLVFIGTAVWAVWEAGRYVLSQTRKNYLYYLP